MNISFGESLRHLRTRKGLSQQQLAKMLFVDRSTVVRWETGSRFPHATLISQIAACIDADVVTLLNTLEESEKPPNVMIVDDEVIILAGGMPVLAQAMPGASIVGFTKPSDALAFAKSNRVAVAFLDIELGKSSGFQLCRNLLQIQPYANVIYLTAHTEYSLDAWSTGACGFMLKPISEQAVRKQLSMLRYPVKGLKTE